MVSWQNIVFYVGITISTILLTALIVNRRKIPGFRSNKYNYRTIKPGSHKQFVNEKLQPMSTQARKNTMLLKSADVEKSIHDLTDLKMEYKMIKTRLKDNKRADFKFKIGVILKRNTYGSPKTGRRALDDRKQRRHKYKGAMAQKVQRIKVTEYQLYHDKIILKELKAFIKKNKNKPNANDAD